MSLVHISDKLVIRRSLELFSYKVQNRERESVHKFLLLEKSYACITHVLRVLYANVLYMNSSLLEAHARKNIVSVTYGHRYSR